MAERIPPQLKEQIVSANDIVDIVSRYVALKRSGNTMVGLCPFHKEKTPSFHVTPDRQLFHCFGCNASGDVIEFVRKIENLDFVDSVKYLAERANINLSFESFNKADNEKYQKRQRVLEINRESARFFRDRLFSEQGRAMLSYIVGRGLSRETILAYGIGAAPDEWDALIKHLTAKGFKRAEILDSGVAVYSEKGRMYDRFRDRLMFPIFDVRGNVIAFGGRYIDDRKPKYLNSSESFVFNKRENLFSLNTAKNFAEGELILVEGYMDVISLYQNGIKNAVASLGTALTNEQARLIARYAHTVTLCYDTDEAGVKATNRAIEVFRGLDIKLKILSLPDGKDPDDFVKKNGGEQFRSLVRGAYGIGGYKIAVLRKRYDISNPEEKVAFLSETAAVLAQVKNSIERETLTMKLAEETGVSAEAITAEVSKIYRRLKNREKYNIPAKETPRRDGRVTDSDIPNIPEPKSSLVKAEQMLLSLCAADYTICRRNKEITAELFTHPVHQKIIEIMNDDKEAEPSGIILHFEEDDGRVAAAALGQPLNFEDNNEAAVQLVETIKKERLDYLIDKAGTEGNVAELTRLIAEKTKERRG